MARDTHVLQVTVFTPQDGRFEDFVARQLEGLPQFGDVPGWRGTLFYRSLDSATAVLLSRWESAEDQKRLSETEMFAMHRASLAPLLETVLSGAYELVYQRAPGGPAT